MDIEKFKKITNHDAKIVKKWPQWMRNITISAEAALTGNFLLKEDNGKK